MVVEEINGRDPRRDELFSKTVAESAVKSCARIFDVGDYIPGQVIYNLGEYPAGFSIAPTEYDAELIKSLAARGVGLIQIHEEWNDSMRRLGADKYTSHDPEGLRKFIDLCHANGIKIIPYVSTGFFDTRDPDFRECFSPRSRIDLNSSYYRYRMCDPASPQWRNYVIPKIMGILDEYDFDGIFNDMGFPVDYVENSEGYMAYDPYLDEMLTELYAKVKSRGGIVKIHEGKCLCPKTSARAYDYLWVGEGVSGLDSLLSTAAFEPYMVPCPDFRFMSAEEENAFYANAITFMQFVLRVDGRPVTGERIDVPGVEYIYNPQNDEKKHFDNVKRWYESHPNGPHVYSEWSSIPDDPQARGKWFYYLDLYRPMVTRGSRVYMDIKESSLFIGELPKGAHATLYVNERKYLCVSNLSRGSVEIALSERWYDRESGEPVRSFSLGYGEIRFLIGSEI
ncbi:MAG: hypothetical protein IJY04_00290 [Clostridia bacterium]|nr:hypothetical protein [Clostridia bacterium]